MSVSSKLAVAALCVASVSPAFAQNSGLVVVDLRNANVANNIARDLDINVSNVPVNVQVPVGIAANVCDVSANVLARQRKDGGATCTATSTSQALNQIVQRQMSNQ